MGLCDICVALDCLHTHQPCIVHGDLKPLNIMVQLMGGCMHNLSYRAKLLDFGLSRIISGHMAPSRLYGTRIWSAPEWLQGVTPMPASDMFSFGVLTQFVVTEESPQENAENTLSSCSWPPGDLTFLFQETSEQCKCFEPDKRPSAEKVYRDIFASESTSFKMSL